MLNKRRRAVMMRDEQRRWLIFQEKHFYEIFFRTNIIMNGIIQWNLFFPWSPIQLVWAMFGVFHILLLRVVEVCFSSFPFFSINFLVFPGAFLIPYFILYFLIGAPIYYLELALGQFSSRGPATGFLLAKGWQGNRNKSFSRKNPRCSIDVEVLDLRW